MPSTLTQQRKGRKYIRLHLKTIPGLTKQVLCHPDLLDRMTRRPTHSLKRLGIYNHIPTELTVDVSSTSCAYPMEVTIVQSECTTSRHNPKALAPNSERPPSRDPDVTDHYRTPYGMIPCITEHSATISATITRRG
jgi:hypothetical protein